MSRLKVTRYPGSTARWEVERETPKGLVWVASLVVLGPYTFKMLAGCLLQWEIEEVCRIFRSGEEGFTGGKP